MLCIVLTLAIPHSALVGSVGNDAAHVSELFCFFYSSYCLWYESVYEYTMNKYCFNRVSTAVAHHFIDYVSVIKTSIVS